MTKKITPFVLFVKDQRHKMPGNVTQEQLAKKAGMRRSFIQDLEAGRVDSLKPEVIKKLSSLFKCDYEEMVNILVNDKYGVSLIPAREIVEGKALKTTVASTVLEVPGIRRQVPVRVRTVITILPGKKSITKCG